MRVRVHEAGQDGRVVEALSLPEVLARGDRRDPPVVTERDGAVPDRLAVDRKHPVGRENSH